MEAFDVEIVDVDEHRAEGAFHPIVKEEEEDDRETVVFVDCYNFETATVAPRPPIIPEPLKEAPQPKLIRHRRVSVVKRDANAIIFRHLSRPPQQPVKEEDAMEVVHFNYELAPANLSQSQNSSAVVVVNAMDTDSVGSSNVMNFGTAPPLAPQQYLQRPQQPQQPQQQYSEISAVEMIAPPETQCVLCDQLFASKGTLKRHYKSKKHLNKLAALNGHRPFPQ